MSCSPKAPPSTSAIVPSSSETYSESMLTDDQELAIDRLFEYDETFLVAPTGAGKTIVFLTAVSKLMDAGVLSRVLVIAPLKVCQTAWTTEAGKWDHLGNISVGIATGDPAERELVLNSDAFNVVVINEENTQWLIKEYDLSPIDGIGIDETSKWSDTSGARFKVLRHKMKGFKWRVGMTAQPVGEDWVGLFGQMLLLDLGWRLGRSRDRFLRKYFYPTDYEQRKWALLPTYGEKLADKISDLVHVMPDYKHELPPKNVKLVPWDLNDTALGLYNEMRRHSVVTLDDGEKITAVNAATLSGKLEQIANGFLYTKDETQVRFATWKNSWVWNRVAKITEAKESVIVVYWFTADLKWLWNLFPDALHLSAGSDVAATMKQWNSHTGQVMLMHPASAGHGVDGLQDTCHRQLWVNPIWSRDKCQQTMDRLWRRGQTETVEIEIAVSRGTIDEVKWDVCEEKGDHHTLFLEHLGPEAVGQTYSEEDGDTK